MYTGRTFGVMTFLMPPYRANIVPITYVALGAHNRRAGRCGGHPVPTAQLHAASARLTVRTQPVRRSRAHTVWVGTWMFRGGAMRAVPAGICRRDRAAWRVNAWHAA